MEDGIQHARRLHLLRNPKRRDVFIGMARAADADVAAPTQRTESDLGEPSFDYLKVLRCEVDMPLRAPT